MIKILSVFWFGVLYEKQSRSCADPPDKATTNGAFCGMKNANVGREQVLSQERRDGRVGGKR